jgi:hypothetical protein
MDDELLKRYNKLIEDLRANTESIDKALKFLDTIDDAIDYIHMLKEEIKNCQIIHNKMFGKNCCDDINLENITKNNEDEYKSVEMLEMKNYLENVYKIINISEIIIDYIKKLKQILEKCKENIFQGIIKLKTKCDELINSIKSTITKINSDTIKTEKNAKLKLITDKHKYDDDLFTNYEKSLENYNKLKQIYDELEKFNIDEFGKVKVYVKLRPSKVETKLDGEYKEYNNIIDIDDVEKKIKIKCKKEEKDYGPFKNICHGSNEDLFEMLKDNFSWEQIKNNTTILFSYGISGSGKSYTMFNNEKDDKGLIFHIFDENFGYSDIGSKDIGSKFETSIEEIFEHKFVDKDFIEIDGLNVEFKPEKLKGEKVKMDIKIDNASKIIENITEKRINNGTIKHTPNNDTSSRSHLFIVFKITKVGKDEGSGYIVLCDSAGRESPLEIAKQYYSDKASHSQIFQGKTRGSVAYRNIIISKLPPKLIKSCETKNCKEYNSKSKIINEIIIGDIEEKQFEGVKKINKYIQDIVKEGFFINESLNHMVKYLDETIERENICVKNITFTRSQCSVDNYNLHENEKDKIYTFQKPSAESSIGTYNIFDDLKDLTKGNYRFIMIANSRTEENRCNSIQNTFDFVNKIKST